MNQSNAKHDNQPRGDQERELLGWVKEFLSQFGLAWKLLWDTRVPFFTKLVPLFVFAYLLLPFDLVPDWLLGVGQVDDLVLVLVGLRMFISLCPPDVVAELEGAEDGDNYGTPVQEIIDLEPEMPSAKRQGNGSR